MFDPRHSAKKGEHKFWPLLMVSGPLLHVDGPLLHVDGISSIPLTKITRVRAWLNRVMVCGLFQVNRWTVIRSLLLVLLYASH